MIFDSLYYDHISTTIIPQSIERHELPCFLKNGDGIATVTVLLIVYNSGTCADLIDVGFGFVDPKSLDCVETDVLDWLNQRYNKIDVQYKF
jgi:hypothetical protein